jgi:hypothetical protein
MVPGIITAHGIATIIFHDLIPGDLQLGTIPGSDGVSDSVLVTAGLMADSTRAGHTGTAVDGGDQEIIVHLIVGHPIATREDITVETRLPTTAETITQDTAVTV